MEILSFSRFDVQFGEEPNSQLNKTLQECLVSFNLSHLVFKVGIIDKKLQPFEALSNLIKVKKINLYLNVKDSENDVVSTFKVEDCNFVAITNANRFLNEFTHEPHIKSDYDSTMIKVSIDAENVSVHDIILWQKENKSLKALQAIDAKEDWPDLNEILNVKKKGSEKRYLADREADYVEYAKQASYEEGPVTRQYVEAQVAVGQMMGGREI